ncbi:MAG TPA: ABC transporter substrate-binding protein [Candidatus Brocadiia bacterium]|nr:ABC transporter substrate-binding protein [Candidatus Brocadiia bacterium]
MTRIHAARTTPAVTAVMAAGALLAVFHLYGCGKREQAGGPVELTYWESWTGFERDALIAVVDKFNQSQDGIKVRMVTVSDMTEKLLLAIAGGCPPDVSMMYGQMLYSYAGKGALTQLDPFVAGTEIKRENYHDIYYDLCTFDGKLWGLPTTPALYAMHWNKALFREAGLDPERPPVNFDELAEHNRRLVRRDEKGRLVQLGFMTGGGDVSEWTGWSWGYWFGGNLWDGKSRLNLDCAGNLDSLMWVLSFYRQFDTVEVTNFLSGCGRFNSPDNPFIAGRVAVVFQGVWMSNFIDKFAPGMEWGAAPFPYYTPEIRDLTVADLDIIAIPKGSPHPKEAFEFIRFLQRRENMELLCGGQKKNSPLAEASEDFINKHPHPYLHVFTKLSASPNILGIPKLGCWFEVEREFMHAREQTTELCRMPKIRERESVLREMLEADEKSADTSRKAALFARARALFAASEIPADIESRLRELKELGKAAPHEAEVARLKAAMQSEAAKEKLDFAGALKLLCDGEECYFRMSAQVFLTVANIRAQDALDREMREKSFRESRNSAMFPISPKRGATGTIEPWRF